MEAAAVGIEVSTSNVDESPTLSASPQNAEVSTKDCTNLTDFNDLHVYNYREHCLGAAWLAFRAFPFPENIAGIEVLLESSKFGVVYIDPETKKVGGFLLGRSERCRLNVANLQIVCVDASYRCRRLASRMGSYMMSGQHPKFKVEDYDEIIVQDTDIYNSPSWLWSDRLGCRYWSYSDQLRRLGPFGYLYMIFSFNHLVPGQFCKRLCKSDAEVQASKEAFRSRGLMHLCLGGLLPWLFWSIRIVLNHGWTQRGTACVAFALVATYLLLLGRFALAHVLAPPSGVRFIAYDFWLSPYGLGLGWPLAVLAGHPLLGFGGGFYSRDPDMNYALEANARALGKMHLLPNLFSLSLFATHTILRIFAYEPVLSSHGPDGGILFGSLFLDTLGTTAAFYCLTDVALPFMCFPSGSIAVRRWSLPLFLLLFVGWLALFLLTYFAVPETVPALSRLGLVD